MELPYEKSILVQRASWRRRVMPASHTYECHVFIIISEHRQDAYKLIFGGGQSVGAYGFYIVCSVQKLNEYTCQGQDQQVEF